MVDNLEVCISFLCANLNECFHSLVLLIHDHISFQPTSKYIWSPELQTLFPLYCRVNSPNYWPSNIGRLMTFDLECVHVQTFYQFDVLWHTFQDWNQVCFGNFRKWNSFSDHFKKLDWCKNFSDINANRFIILTSKSFSLLKNVQ